MSVEGDGWLPVPSSALGLPSIQGVAQDSSGGDLPWQSVDVTALHSGTTSFEDGGFLGLEVVEGACACSDCCCGLSRTLPPHAMHRRRVHRDSD